MSEAPSVSLYDIHQSAYLALHGIEPTLANQGTTIVFEFCPSEKVYALLREYKENPSVNILDFVSCLRKLRARILAQRGGAR